MSANNVNNNSDLSVKGSYRLVLVYVYILRALKIYL